jgi:predicted permease
MRVERWLYTLPLRLRSLLHAARADQELDEELHFHIEQLCRENEARGMSTSEARQAALKAMHGLEQRKEECRDTRRVRLVQDLLRDARHGARNLRRYPAFAAAAIATITLGIGATLAVFTVFNGVLLRPMPFPDPERLFVISDMPAGPFVPQPALSDRNYLAYRSTTRTFDRIAAYSIRPASLTGAGDPAIVQVSAVTSDFFALLRVPPALGRVFDEHDGNERVVLGDALWRSAFGGDSDVLGRSVAIDGIRRVVVGVMPAGFRFPERTQAWLPETIRLDPHLTLAMPSIGRLRSGATVAGAAAEFGEFVRHQDGPPNRSGRVIPLKDVVVGDVRRPLQLFSGAVGFVLLIACANVANLLLARASGRRREMAVRAALGAGRGRLIRQLVTESTLLALAGGAFGVLLARWSVPALLALAPERRIPRTEFIHVDAQVVVFAVLVSLLTGAAFGLVSALPLTRREFESSLLPGGRAFSSPRNHLRSALVVIEIGLALVLLVGAGLLVRSLVRLRDVDFGFRPDHVISVTVDLPETAYPDVDRLGGFHHDMVERLSRMPGVSAAGAVNWRPLGGALVRGDFQIEGGSPATGRLLPDKPAISAGYFAAMGIHLVRGRDFTLHDDRAAQPVAIVSRTIANLMGGEQRAIGRRVTLEDNPAADDWLTVIGVVDDVRQLGPAETPHAAIYQPYLQVKRPFFLRTMTFVVRSHTDPVLLAPQLKTILRGLDNNLPPQSLTTMSEAVAGQTAEPAFHARLLSIFAVLALLLSAIGIYGVVAYTVSQRTREIGVRMALGASPRSAVIDVLRHTFVLTAAGSALGVLGAVMTTRLLSQFLFEVTTTDPATFAGVALLLGIVALGAAAVPALRAAAVDPVRALRHD